MRALSADGVARLRASGAGYLEHVRCYPAHGVR